MLKHAGLQKLSKLSGVHCMQCQLNVDMFISVICPIDGVCSSLGGYCELSCDLEVILGISVNDNGPTSISIINFHMKPI